MLTYLTPSDVIEYLFCPRYTYYLNVLDIGQNEQDRYLVAKGRELHQRKIVQNKDFLRKKIGSLGKEVNVYMTSPKLRLAGIVDEVHFLDNDKATVLDYKYAFYENRVYRTMKIQQVLYALLVEEKYNKRVENAYLVYVRSSNRLVEIQIDENLKAETCEIVDDVFNIISNNRFPKATTAKKKCLDCCYQNLCDN